MGQVHTSALQVLQGESFTMTWTYYLNQHTITLATSGGETGTWQINVEGQLTAALTPTASAADVAAALNALGVVNAQGQATVGKSGTAPVTYTITWPGDVTVPDGTRDDALSVVPAIVPQCTVTVARVVKDLTGYTPYSQAREKRGDTSSPLIWDSIGPPATATFNTLDSTGQVILSITHDDTQAMTATSGYYDVHLVDGPGNDERFVEGPVTIVDGTTFR